MITFNIYSFIMTISFGIYNITINLQFWQLYIKDKFIIEKMSNGSSYLHRQSDIYKYKKKLPIKSLQAAICNVALFKNMKQKQFRQTIFISYCQDGVILQSLNQVQWQRACQYVQDFLYDKRISLLTYGFQKQTYQDLIIKGLKQYTRRIKEQGQQCPYINIIHYQKLRKSCQYMDKQRYSEPLRYWEGKNKINPNFAFLVVEPVIKFQEVKRYLLQVLLKKQIQLNIEYFSLFQFVYVFFNSSHKDQIKQLCDRKIIETQVIKHTDIKQNDRQSHQQLYLKKSIAYDDKFKLMNIVNKSQYLVRIVNYSDLILNQYDIKIIKHTANLSKLGLQYISSKEIQKQVKSISKYVKAPNSIDGKQISVTQIYESLHNQILTALQQQQWKQAPSQLPCPKLSLQKAEPQYSMIPYKCSEKQKYLQLLQKLLKTTTNKQRNLQDLNHQLIKYQICQYDQIDFIKVLPKGNKELQQGRQEATNMYKVSINDCPYMVVEYHKIPINQLDTFLFYLEQLRTYYCTYLIRFYGISIRYGQQIHSSHQEILREYSPSLLSKIKSKQVSHSYQQLSRSKIQEYSYYLIFDYHHRTIQMLIKNDLIIDNLQIANICLQLLYLCQFLHSHDEPRCLGSLSLSQTCWPMCLILPYLGSLNSISNINMFQMNCSDQGFQGDVKLVGQLIKFFIGDHQDEQGDIDRQLASLSQAMINENKHQRITIVRVIPMLEDLLGL